MIDTLRERLARFNDEMAHVCTHADRSPDSVRLVVVTKTHTASILQACIEAGQHDLGENRVQEIQNKVPQLNGRVDMHMIGHLQTNKVETVVPLVAWIHSVDSERLLRKIEQASEKSGKRPKILVQVNTTGEPSKSGCSPDETLALCALARNSDWVEFRGLMTIGPLAGGEAPTRRSFALLRQLRDQILSVSGSLELSMGMSGDWRWAIEEGSTMLRIGSLILGDRVK
jgi:PLP dependent protein